MDMQQKKRVSYEDIINKLDSEEITPEMQMVDDNMDFEKQVLENPIPPGIGQVDVFGETWDINMILKGNYWGRTIYTTDKICKLFLKWNIERQKKYLAKKNPLGFDYTWLILLVIGAVAFVLILIFLLPQIGGAI